MDGVAWAQDGAGAGDIHGVGADGTHDGGLRDDGTHAGADGIPYDTDGGCDAAAIGDLRQHYSLLPTAILQVPVRRC